MKKVANGDTVKVHYTGTLEDGSVFDSSRDQDPLTFKLGEGKIIPGFEEAVMGLQVGESKKITIPCKEAYGEYRDDMVMAVPKDQFPEDIKPELGQQLQIDTGQGQPILVSVIKMTESEVTLDGNHPMAGKDLTFDIELLEIQ